MGELREIVEVQAVERLFVLLAVVGPVAGALIGAAIGARCRQMRHGLLRGLLVGLFGPLNWLLWHIYNALTDRNGLDTVRNLVVNLVLFVVVGAVIGLGIGWMQRRTALPTPTEESLPEGPP